jgi:hypothetical protein
VAAVTGLPESPNSDQIRSEIDAVLASDIFARAPSLAQFLSYVCRKVLSGESDQIKEYNIAVEAFGRQANFDQKADAIVRVEAHRLRKRLKQYYDTEGATHPIRIVIPPGQYVPNFVLAPADETPLEEKTAEFAVAAPTELALVRSIPIELPAPGPPLELEPPAPDSSRRWWVVGAVVGLALCVVLLVFVFGRAGGGAGPATAGNGSASGGATLAGGMAEEGIRIAGGLTAPKYVDTLGNTWLGDRYFVGGQVRTSPSEAIQRSRDPALYQNRREGDFRYDIPLEPGVYELHLCFAERVFGAGNIAGGGESSRLFNVFINGGLAIQQLDVVSDAEGSNTADEKVIKDVTPGPDGFLHLRFATYKESAFVNGIEIVPTVRGKTRPLRILAGVNSFRDASGRLWVADEYSTGGQVVVRSTSISGTPVPEAYRSERYGNFSYAIPVAPGRYSVTLHFAEAWFGPWKPSGGGEGSRVFDVYCNGTALLKGFDIFKTAGGEGRAVAKTFRGLTANAQGKLMLTFAPVHNYASLNAIEIIPED